MCEMYRMTQQLKYAIFGELVTVNVLRFGHLEDENHTLSFDDLIITNFLYSGHAIILPTMKAS